MTPLTAIPMQPLAQELGDPSPRLDALVALHTRTVDTLPGYEKMVEKAEPAFRPVAESFRALHVRHAEILSRLLVSNGYRGATDGSIMGTINQTVVAVRAMFDDIDADLMSSIRNGESHVLAAFDAALQHSQAADEMTQISTMRDELVALLDSSPAA